MPLRFLQLLTPLSARMGIGSGRRRPADNSEDLVASDQGTSKAAYEARLHEFSRLTGAMADVPTDRPYRLEYRTLMSKDGRYVGPILLSVVTVAVELAFLGWLFRRGHLARFNGGAVTVAATIIVLAGLGITEVLRLVNVVSLAVASLLGRDPVPVRPESGMRVAFVTTIVPNSEPIEVVRQALEAARTIRYEGQLDVWLLDEGDDSFVKAMCRQVGVNHFSRKGVACWNQTAGPHKAKSKHGNYNAWLEAHGDGYDIMLSVDPDHVPLPSYAERMLGYFRDPNIAFVVAPQNYLNCDNFVTTAAESQQFPFHAIIQRAANAYGCPMLVGTNNAIRISALRQIGGLRDSITEDMATGLAFHTSRNPSTGRRWTSVYTPDVVAVGEGPSTWSDYFSQQMRWSRGTFEVLLTTFWRRAFRLRPRQLLHYALILTFYPSMALGWLLGAVNAILFLALGASGIHVSPSMWLMLYVDSTAFALSLYVRARRFNVSPNEHAGSFGLVGMLMSIMAAPIFATSLVGALLRRPARFLVTPKGESASADGLATFRHHLQWTVLLGAALVLAIAVKHTASLQTFLWPGIAIAISLLPVILWKAEPRSAMALTFKDLPLPCAAAPAARVALSIREARR